MNNKEVMQQALEALEHESDVSCDDAYRKERDALRAALAQPEPEPVAWINEHGDIDRGWDAIRDPTGWTPLYTAPPQRKPLTEDEISEIAMSCSFVSESDTYFARAIEKAHGIGGEE